MTGDSLNPHPYLEVLEVKSSQELRDKLKGIRLPYKLVSIYYDGEKHVAWISLSRKPRNSKGVNNVSSR